MQDIHSQGEVIACLEKGLVREAEEQRGAHVIKDDCKKSIMRVAELSSDDFHLDRYLYFACRDDRERFCENVRNKCTFVAHITSMTLMRCQMFWFNQQPANLHITQDIAPKICVIKQLSVNCQGLFYPAVQNQKSLKNSLL